MRNVKSSWTAPISGTELRPVVLGMAFGLMSSGVLVGLLFVVGFGTP